MHICPEKRSNTEEDMFSKNKWERKMCTTWDKTVEALKTKGFYRFFCALGFVRLHKEQGLSLAIIPSCKVTLRLLK